MPTLPNFRVGNPWITTRLTMRSTFVNGSLIGLLLMAGCRKEDAIPDPAPSIEVVSIMPATAQQYSDAVTVRTRYRDNNGDLGENTAGVKNCFAVDNRIGIRYEYRISQLAPSGSAVPIEGEVDINLGGQGILDSLASEERVTFTVTVVDRAGNSSNPVTTPEVRIIR